MPHVGTVSCIIVLVAAAARAQVEIEPQGNLRLTTNAAVLGETLVIGFNGQPLAQYVLLSSLGPGIIPAPPFGTLWLGAFGLAATPINGFSGNPLTPPLFPNGNASFPVAVPSTPALDGIAVYLQAFAQDSGAPAGLAFSNAKSLLLSAPDGYKATNLPMGVARAFHQTTPLPNGSYLVTGGGGGDLLIPVATASVERYNPYHRVFTADQPMSVPRTIHRATPLQDGRVILTGGSLTGGCPSGTPVGTVCNILAPGFGGLASLVSTAEIYDPATNAWSAPITMAASRMAHTATLLPDGRVFLYGGAASFAIDLVGAPNDYAPIFSAARGTGELFDPATNSFTLVTPPPGVGLKRFGHAASLLPDGRVFISGGITGNQTIFGIGAPLFAAACALFDPATNTFAAAAPMIIPRAVHTQHVLPNGTVLVVGGVGGNFVATTAATEIYNPLTNTWSPGPLLPGGSIALHAGVGLPDGSVYIAGGAVGALSSFQGVKRAYRYQVGSGFTQLGDLNTERQTHTANVTPEGVLLIGGADAGSPAMGIVPTAVTSAVYWAPF